MRKKLFSFFLVFFGLKKNKVQNNKKGLVIILIDGLSYAALNYAMKSGFSPTIKKLSSHAYVLRDYYCGLPAATTATEALLFYGNNFNIPGFTWYDRGLNMFVRGNRSRELALFEDSYSKYRTLLKNGSAIMSVYNGGATQLSISGRDLTFTKSLNLLKAFHYFFMAILYPLQLVRTLYLTLKTIILYKPSHRDTALETFSKIILGQFSCFLTEIEIMRNTETIFVDFLLYDEYAHVHGPTHPTTLSTLRLVDRYIKRIMRTASSAEKKYEIVVLSDHGQTESVPCDIDELKSAKDIKAALNEDSYTVLKTYGGFIPTKSNYLYVVPAGSTLQLYFSDFLKVAPIEAELETKFPRFISRLLTCAEFGWVLVRQSESSSVLYGKKGKVEIQSDGSHLVTGTPFPNMNSEEVNSIIKSFSFYMTFPNNGDLVVFGSVIDNKKVISFERHKGTHGGFYGPMTHPFVMSKNPHIQGSLMNELFDTIEEAMI